LNILLINPPNDNEIIGNDLDTTRKYSGFYPPLGLMYIESILKEQTNHKVKLIDCQAMGITYELLEHHLINNRYDTIGITCLTLCLVDVKKTIDLIKRVSPFSKIICGGPHATIYPYETNSLGADKVVVGEGDNFITDVLRTNGKVFSCHSKIEDLDSIPFPIRDNPKIYYSILSSKITNSMITTRGCPYQCTFCDRPAMGRKYRERSPSNVVDEIEDCILHGIEEINMYDDTFTINRGRVLAICDEIEKRNLKFTWDIRARVNTVDLELLKRLRSVGCIRIRMGVESGVQRILDILKKGITIPQIKSAFKAANEAGMETFSYFMIGNPEETKQDIETSWNLSRELKAKYAQFTIFCPFPSTKIYSDWLNIHDRDIWRDFSLNPTSGFIPPHWDQYFNVEELRTMLKKIYKSYYFTPSFIWSKLKGIKNINNAKLLVKAAFELAK
jgi:radical SAM superfamily enzyme YgiQ (UPF0313 family)